jgi:DNA gyrase subunit A
MKDVSVYSRITSGVKLIKLDEGAQVVSIAKVREKVSDGNRELDDVEENTDELMDENINNFEEDADEISESDTESEENTEE